MRGLSLLDVATSAGVSRGMARSAVARGLLGKAPYTPVDVVLLKVATACLAYPDPHDRPRAKSAPGGDRPGRRDATALRFARAILADPMASPTTVLVLAPSGVDVVDTPDEIGPSLQAWPGSTVMVLPVGTWAHQLR